MTKPQSTFKRFITNLLKIYRVFRSVILNFFFLLFVLLILASMMGTPPTVVPENAALVFAPQGSIVDEKSYVDPLNSILESSINGSIPSELLLQDVLNMFELAASDSSISALVLQLDALGATGFSKLQEIGLAITEFKTSGKKVYAVADSYTQGQYYLASHADEIMVNPLGGVDLEGFSSYQTYYGSALEKLGVNMHIFRVGTFKSAVEPYERDDMSPAAKEANIAWLGDLWELYLEDIGQQRELSAIFISEIIATLDQQLANYSGDTAEFALQTGLIDSIRTRSEISTYLNNEIGTDFNSSTFTQVDFTTYLAANPIKPSKGEQGSIGLIVATGNILDGFQRPGSIGGDSLANLIREAKDNDAIKALVLRIDSGGGSAFASEIIRSELLEFKETGKPFVVSMGSVAASGGYWIAAPADQIWASASTITGSIGIFAVYPTFENTFDTLGIHTDGVGTTPLSGSTVVGRNLPDIASNAIQLNLENGYERFLRIVSEGRGMTTEEVDNIGQGRVWSGATAHELGLVDEIGNLEQAINAAADLAAINDFNTVLIGAPLSPREQFLQELTQNISVLGFDISTNKQTPKTNNILMKFYEQINEDVQAILEFNDPRGMYLHCFECGTN